LTVALDITVTDALRTEGVARELVKRIQNIRKESNFEITDRIVVELTRSEQTDKAVVDFADYISTQVLANEIKTVDHIEDGVEIDFDDYKIYLKVQKV
jgi:isoleucyl-tRNA synthetase